MYVVLLLVLFYDTLYGGEFLRKFGSVHEAHVTHWIITSDLSVIFFVTYRILI